MISEAFTGSLFAGSPGPTLLPWSDATAPEEQRLAWQFMSPAIDMERLTRTPILRAGACTPTLVDEGVAVSAERAFDGSLELTVGTLLRNCADRSACGTLIQTALDSRSRKLGEARTAFHLGPHAHEARTQQMTVPLELALTGEPTELMTVLRCGGVVIQELRLPFALREALTAPEPSFLIRS